QGLLAVRMMLRNQDARLIDTDEGRRCYQSAYACCDRRLVGHDDHPLHRQRQMSSMRRSAQPGHWQQPSRSPARVQTIETRSEVVETSLQARTNRRSRNPETPSDLERRQLFEVAEQNGGAVRLLELGQQRRELSLQLCAFDQRLRGRGDAVRFCEDLTSHPARSTTSHHPCDVAGDGREPPALFTRSCWRTLDGRNER